MQMGSAPAKAWSCKASTADTSMCMAGGSVLAPCCKVHVLNWPCLSVMLTSFCLWRCRCAPTTTLEPRRTSCSVQCAARLCTNDCAELTCMPQRGWSRWTLAGCMCVKHAWCRYQAWRSFVRAAACSCGTSIRLFVCEEVISETVCDKERMQIACSLQAYGDAQLHRQCHMRISITISWMLPSTSTRAQWRRAAPQAVTPPTPTSAYWNSPDASCASMSSATMQLWATIGSASLQYSCTANLSSCQWHAALECFQP